MTSPRDDLTAQGAGHVAEYLGSLDDVKYREREKIRADGRLYDAQQKLGKWLAPEDARDGEVFCVWYGDSLISVKCRYVIGTINYDVSIRTSGRSIQRHPRNRIDITPVSVLPGDTK